MEPNPPRPASITEQGTATAQHAAVALAHAQGNHPLTLWRLPLRWLAHNSFAPAWLARRWRHPLVGYVLVTLLQLAAALATLLLVVVFPTFSFPEALPMLVVALVALSWGATYSVYATLIGTALLEIIVLPQTAHGGVDRAGDVVEIALCLLVGGLISITASSTERARRKSEQGRVQALGREMALREMSQRTDEFLGIASHELRSPLTTIKSALQLGQRKLARHRCDAGVEPAQPIEPARDLASVAEVLDVAEHEVDRQNRLIGDLLDASRIRADKLDLRMRSMDLAPVVCEAVEAQRLAWPDRVIELAVPAGDMLVNGDGQRIGQVVTNFLTNALKYSADDRLVAVALTVQGDSARVSVRDAGPGLTPEQQAGIWERFHRVPGIKQQSGSGAGLGLGLYICRTIIQRHGGEVGVESVVGCGSTFWFRVPLAQGGV